jgi:sporulation protein YlmC with PRC-barrel domain
MDYFIQLEGRCDIEILVGKWVEDKNGKLLGTVTNIIRDSWTGEIRKFSVSSQQTDIVLFYSPADVSESSEARIKLKMAVEEFNREIQFGAKVFDKNGKLIGIVDYPVLDSLTGEVKRFKVKTDSDKEGLLFSAKDVDKLTPDEVRLK